MQQTKAGVKAASLPERTRVKLDGVSQSYDARVRAIRPDLADVALAELYFAPHYAAAAMRSCTAASAMVRSAPNASASALTELVHGEAFHMLDSRNNWAWGYCGHDHYVGYLPMDALGEPVEATHSLRAVAPLFAAADIKSPVQTLLPLGARLTGSIEDGFLATADGYVHVRHIRALGAAERDWVAVAQRYLGAPYIWGGRGFGVDCSGLVQMALDACGITAPRDTDQQEAALGATLIEGTALQRSDIIFFPGHVGLMVDDAHMIHANAHWMAVTIEPLADVVARLKPLHDQPISSMKRITT